MADAIRLRQAVAAKTVTIGSEILTKEDGLASVSHDDLAAAYAEVQAEEKALAERKSALQSEVRARLIDGKLETGAGTFRLEERKSLSWSVEDVKDIMGRAWTSFVKADDAVLRERMRSGDVTSEILAKFAAVRTVEAITFRK